MASEKRILDTHTLWATHIIFDIEGTTTSISFVKDTLFPYIREHLEQYVNDSWKDEGFQNIVAALREQAKTDENDGLVGFVAIPEGDNDEVKNAVIKNVLWQMDNDRKTKSLKDLQSLVMTSGYEAGNIIGHIYDDVETNLKAWKGQGKLLYIYSSGSVNAQKLLFGNTNKGNLLNLFSGHFDTLVGPKMESASYRKIVDDLKCEPGDVLFFTDIPAEAKAAVGAGLQAVLVSRVGNAPLSDQDKADFTVIHSFSDIEFEQNAKKRKMLNDTNCDIKIDNKEVEHSSTYISEAVSGEGDDKTKPNITVDTDVEMAEVEEKVNCTGASKEETEIMEEVDSCKESDVNKKVQPNTDLAKDIVKSSESINEKNVTISGENEIEETNEKNSDVGKKDGFTVAQNENKCSVGGEVGKETSGTDGSDTVKSVNKLSDNQPVSIMSNENREAEGTGNENRKSVDSSDSKVMKLSGKSDQEEKNKVSPLGKDNVEIAHTDKTDKDTLETSNADENNKADVSEVDTNEVENKPGEASKLEKNTNDEMTNECSEVGSRKESDVKETDEISRKSEGISCTTSVEIGESTVKAMDVTEPNHDTECKREILKEENKPLSDGIVTRQSENEGDQKIVTEVTATETKSADVCSVENLAQRETAENESNVGKKSELQEKVIKENSVCSKMEIENCDVKRDTCEKDNSIKEKSDAVETLSDSVVELQKEESKPVNNDDVHSGTSDVNEKENDEESVKTENSKTEAVCVNSVHETKDECSKVGVEKIINSNNEKENNSSVNKKEDMTVTSTAVNGKHCENDSCDIDTKEGNGDVGKVQVEMTPNGDTQASHGNDKTDHDKTDTIINEKTGSNTIVNGGTENIADSVPEVKKVINDAANNSAVEAISQPV